MKGQSQFAMKSGQVSKKQEQQMKQLKKQISVIKSDLKELDTKPIGGVYGGGKSLCGIELCVNTLQDGSIYLNTTKGTFELPEALQSLPAYQKELIVSNMIGALNKVLAVYGQERKSILEPIQTSFQREVEKMSA